MYQQISERALFARINRVLAKENQQLHACRDDSRFFNDLGRYYITDVRLNTMIASGINDLNNLAKELEINARA